MKRINKNTGVSYKSGDLATDDDLPLIQGKVFVQYNLNRLKKTRKDVKKISRSRKIGKSDELTELTETWDEDLCE